MALDHLPLQDGAAPLNRLPSPLWSIASVASVPSSETATPRRIRRAQPTTSRVPLRYPSPVSSPLSFSSFLRLSTPRASLYPSLRIGQGESRDAYPISGQAGVKSCLLTFDESHSLRSCNPPLGPGDCRQLAKAVSSDSPTTMPHPMLSRDTRQCCNRFESSEVSGHSLARDVLMRLSRQIGAQQLDRSCHELSGMVW